MAQPLKVEITGMKELAEKLRKLGDPTLIDAASAGAVTDAGEIMTDKLVSAAPEASQYYPDVPKGFLKENVNMVVLRDKAGIWTAFCGPNPHINYPPRKSTMLTKTGKVRKRRLKTAKYARGPWLPLVAKWIEFGTSRSHGAHPWIRPVWSQTWKRSLDAMISSLKDWLKDNSR